MRGDCCDLTRVGREDGGNDHERERENNKTDSRWRRKRRFMFVFGFKVLSVGMRTCETEQ